MKQNFLKQVLVRVDFQKPLESYEKGLYPSVEKAIKRTFPTLVEYKIQQKSVLFESGCGRVINCSESVGNRNQLPDETNELK